MEEARQHPTLTGKQTFFAAAYVGGLLVMLAGLFVQVVWHVDSFIPAIIFWGVTRIGLSAWQLIQPDLIPGNKAPPTRLAITIALWTLVVALLITVEMAK